MSKNVYSENYAGDFSVKSTIENYMFDIVTNDLASSTKQPQSISGLCPQVLLLTRLAVL